MDAKMVFVRRFSGIVLLVAVVLGGVPASWGAETDYYGTYAGTFSGGDEGVWIGVLSDHPLAHIFMSYLPKFDFGDGGNIFFVGETGTAGTFIGTSQMGGSSINVVMESSDRSVSGDWLNPPVSGTLKGVAVTNCSSAGSFSGTISGDVSGTMTGTIASDGTVTVKANIGGPSFDMLGACHPDGYIMGYGTDPDGFTVGMVGRVSESGSYGEWESETGATGTFIS